MSVYVQPEGRGPLKPSQCALFGEFEGEIAICNLDTGESFGFADLAADIWRGIIKYGNPEDVTSELFREYDVDEARLRRDLRAFINDLLAKGLLEQTDDANSTGS